MNPAEVANSQRFEALAATRNTDAGRGTRLVERVLAPSQGIRVAEFGFRLEGASGVERSAFSQFPKPLI